MPANHIHHDPVLTADLNTVRAAFSRVNHISPRDVRQALSEEGEVDRLVERCDAVIALLCESGEWVYEPNGYYVHAGRR